MTSKTFQVPNIGCDGCVRTVENELKQIAGVQLARADEASKMVTVEWDDPANWDQIVNTLTEIDYPPA
jgi:copper chaperone CopZ